MEHQELTDRLAESVFAFQAAIPRREKGGLMATLASQPSSIGWRFWVYWMLATIAGAAIFILATMPLNAIGAASQPEVGATGPRGVELPAMLAIGALGTALMGTLFGLGQWLVLRKYLPRTGWWVLATLVGYSIPLSSGMLYAGGPSELGPVFMGLEFGIALGVLQWLVLRNRVYQAGWWIPITLAGWVLAFALTGAVYLSGMYIEPMDMLFAFLVPVAVAGAGMAWLLRRTAQRGGGGTSKATAPA